jgi:hypothetical protein
MEKSIIGILGFALGGIGSIWWGILIATKIFPNIDKKWKINQLDFFKILGSNILFGIGATLFFYARNENSEIIKILFYLSFGISFSCFLYTHYNSSLEKNIEEKEIFIVIIGFVFAIIGIVIFFKSGLYIDAINGVKNGK